MKYDIYEIESLCRCNTSFKYKSGSMVLNFVPKGYESTEKIYSIDIEDNEIEIIIEMEETK